MAQGNFQRCLAFTLTREGGFSNDPHDPGGATMYGIIQREYDAWKKAHGLPLAPVRWISTSDRDAIYMEQYWNAMRCEELPLGVDLMVFDFGVNSGVVKSVKELQVAVGAAPVDGHLGLITMGRVRGVNDHAALINKLSARRLSFLQALRNWKYFGNGWRSRVKLATVLALKMASN